MRRSAKKGGLQACLAAPGDWEQGLVPSPARHESLSSAAVSTGFRTSAPL